MNRQISNSWLVSSLSNAQRANSQRPSDGLNSKNGTEGRWVKMGDRTESPTAESKR